MGIRTIYHSINVKHRVPTLEVEIHLHCRATSEVMPQHSRNPRRKHIRQVFYRIYHPVGAARLKDPRVQNDCISYTLW